METKAQKIPAVVIGDLQLLHCFLGTGIPTISVIRSDDDVTRYSRLFRSSGLTVQELHSLGETEFLRRLLDIGARTKTRPVLYYGDDEILSLLMRNREIVHQHFRLTLPTSEILVACGEKRMFHDLAVSHGLPVPRGMKATDDLCAQQVAKEIGFPCVLKPSSHVGWHNAMSSQMNDRMPRKVILAENAEQCAAALSSMRGFSDEFVIQECIAGGEDQIYSYHAYRPQSGPVAASFVGRKIRTYPSEHGESTFLKLVRNGDVERLGKEIVQTLDLRGPIKIDFKRAPDGGKFYLLEVNLRYTLWNNLGARCGNNIPLLAYQDACGSPMEISDTYRTNKNWLNFEDDARTFFKDYRPAGKLSVTAWLGSILQPKVCAIFAWQDPLPFVIKTSRTFLRITRKLSRRVFA